MATLSLCSLLPTTLSSHKQIAKVPFISLSKTHLNFLSSVPHLSSPGLSTPKPLTLPFVSAAEVSLADSEQKTTESEATEVVETPIEEPKREEIFAVVMIGSRQYIVFPGRFIYTQRLKGANVNDKVVLNKVLLIGTKTSAYLGTPVVPNAAVHAVVEEQGLDKKVVVFKYKKKKNYRRNIGHRQPNTRLRILGITGYENAPAITAP